MTDNPECRQNHDINFWMAKEPEQMQEQNWIAAPSGIKKVVPKFLSVNNMVIAPANTGTASNSKKAVINIAHANNGILCRVMPGVRILKIVVIKLAAPRIEDTPAKCRDKNRQIHRHARRTCCA